MPSLQLAGQLAAHPDNQSLLWAKRGIWLYFWLLIIEGALRKWIVPQLNAPLLIVRDPVVFFIYWHAYRSRRVSGQEMTLFCMVGFAILLLAVTQFAAGTNDLLTAAFGVRSYLLHLPLIFVMKYVLTFEDVRRIGRWLLIVSVPMALLMTLQYRAPSNAWLNNGAGGVSRAQLAFSGEHIRASGTFAFINGISDFFPFVEAFLIFAIAQIGVYPKWLLSIALIANIVAIPMSGSRTLFFSFSIVLVCGVLSLLSSGRSMVRFIKIGAGVVLAGVLCLQLPVFRDSLASFEERWSGAQAQEGDGAQGSTRGTLQSRVLDIFLSPFNLISDVPLLGEGIGAGSNVASVAKTGEQSFMLSEGEWPRVIQECGPIFGFLFLGYRVALCVMLFSSAVRLRGGNAILGVLLAAATLPQLLSNVIEQPTNQGFMAFGAGLCLASAKRRNTAPSPSRTARAARRIPSAPATPHPANAGS